MRSVEPLIQAAEHVRKTRPSRAQDLDFLHEVFNEVGLNLSPCEIASVTYLTWHGSASESGVTFREHLTRLKIDSPCELDPALKTAISAHRADQARLQRERDQAAESEGRLFRVGVAAGVGSLVALGAFVMVRRSKLAAEREEAERQSRRERRRHRRHARHAQASAPGAGDPLTPEQAQQS